MPKLENKCLLKYIISSYVCFPALPRAEAVAGITNDKLQLESLACRQQGLVAVQSSLTGDLTMASFLERVRAQYQHPRASRILDPDQTGQAPALELTFFLEMITRQKESHGRNDLVPC